MGYSALLRPRDEQSFARKSSHERQNRSSRRGRIRRTLRSAWQRCGPEFSGWKGQAHLFGLAVFSALVLRLAFPRWNVAIVAAVGLAPFLWAVANAKSGKQAFYLGWVFGAVYYYVLLIWLHVLIVYHPVIPAALVLLGLYLGLFKALFAWLAWRMARRGGTVYWAVAAAWVAAEYIQSLGDLGFPWGYLGHGLWRHPPLLQLTAWTGVYGLSFVLFWANHLLCDSTRALRRETSAPPARQLLARLAILAGFGGAVLLSHLGARHRVHSEDFYATPPATIGIVQPNIPQRIKVRSYSWDTPEEERARLQSEILRKTITVTDQLQSQAGADACDLVIWPETAVTDEFFVFRPAYETLFDDLATTRFGTALFFGATKMHVLRMGRFVAPEDLDLDDYRLHPEAYAFEFYNSTWLVEPGRGFNPTIYSKTRLVPFGEGLPYIQRVKPLAALISKIAGIVPLSAASKHVVYTLRGRDGSALLRFGPLICYESCYPDLSRKRVRRGAELLVIITNDAWYERTAGAASHQLQAIFRAVETRRWVARCANHGISCFVSPLGEIVAESDLAREATVKWHVRGVKELTFYSRWGDVFAWLTLAGTCGFVVLARKRQR
ncbi:hypothetical protein AMJ85_04705 [candidate division BRC1 bacterium SM23_51]|nr:MAG: hypothetical protein AMJ85_04705 [candidate division BRC1 bacterium SM23_51]